MSLNSQCSININALINSQIQGAINSALSSVFTNTGGILNTAQLDNIVTRIEKLLDKLQNFTTDIQQFESDICNELQQAVAQATGAIQGFIDGIENQLETLSPFFAVLQLPTNPLKILKWAAKLIVASIAPQIVAYIKLIIKISLLLSELPKILAAVEKLLPALEKCALQISIPGLSLLQCYAQLAKDLDSVLGPYLAQVAAAQDQLGTIFSTGPGTVLTTGTLSTGSTLITSLGSTQGITVGQQVVASGVAAGIIVSAVGGDTVTMSAAFESNTQYNTGIEFQTSLATLDTSNVANFLASAGVTRSPNGAYSYAPGGLLKTFSTQVYGFSSTNTTGLSFTTTGIFTLSNNYITQIPDTSNIALGDYITSTDPSTVGYLPGNTYVTQIVDNRTVIMSTNYTGPTSVANVAITFTI
jgi:hypothetical protein